jgi:hypothetical protein
MAENNENTKIEKKAKRKEAFKEFVDDCVRFLQTMDCPELLSTIEAVLRSPDSRDYVTNNKYVTNKEPDIVLFKKDDDKK